MEIKYLLLSKWMRKDERERELVTLGHVYCYSHLCGIFIAIKSNSEFPVKLTSAIQMKEGETSLCLGRIFQVVSNKKNTNDENEPIQNDYD